MVLYNIVTMEINSATRKIRQKGKSVREEKNVVEVKENLI
jgi:hypothetical protein